MNDHGRLGSEIKELGVITRRLNHLVEDIERRREVLTKWLDEEEEPVVPAEAPAESVERETDFKIRLGMDPLVYLEWLAVKLESEWSHDAKPWREDQARSLREALAALSQQPAGEEWTGPFPQGEAWIGVDLDGTLALYDGWQGPEHIGEPIALMLERVRAWVAEGTNVAILTARVSVPEQRATCIPAIEEWCQEHVGQRLPITFQKDYGMVELWDDRAVQVIPNTGLRADSPTDLPPSTGEPIDHQVLCPTHGAVDVDVEQCCPVCGSDTELVLVTEGEQKADSVSQITFCVQRYGTAIDYGKRDGRTFVEIDLDDAFQVDDPPPRTVYVLPDPTTQGGT